MTRDWNATKTRYLQFDSSHQLGHLASNLARLRSFCNDPLYQEAALSVIEESQHFIEWTVPSMDLDVAAELVDLQRQLSNWKQHWSALWSNKGDRIQVAEQAQGWCDRLLDHSGLLADKVILQ